MKVLESWGHNFLPVQPWYICICKDWNSGWRLKKVIHYLKQECKIWKRWCLNMSWLMTKPTKWPVHPAKPQISLGIRPVWSESSLCSQWVAKSQAFFMQTAKTDQTRLIFDGRTYHFVSSPEQSSRRAIVQPPASALVLASASTNVKVLR